MNASAACELLPAALADMPVVRNLLACYIHDLSEYLHWPCPANGRFGGCDGFFTRWQAGLGYPFLLRVGGELAGFAGVGLEEATREFFIDEFFLLRKFRRQGIGASAARQLFEAFAGKWRVEVLAANSPARRFWEAVISDYTPARTVSVSEEGQAFGPVHVHRFYRPVPAEMTFLDPPRTPDRELELQLIRLIPPDPARERLPVYDFQIMVRGCPAGNINLRAGNTHAICTYAGHIGYGVFPAFRGHRYAGRACRLLFPLARAHGLATLWITANPDNAASRRTCERLGARLVETIALPEDTELYRIGEREKCRYRLTIA